MLGRPDPSPHYSFRWRDTRGPSGRRALRRSRRQSGKGMSRTLRKESGRSKRSTGVFPCAAVNNAMRRDEVGPCTICAVKHACLRRTIPFLSTTGAPSNVIETRAASLSILRCHDQTVPCVMVEVSWKLPEIPPECSCLLGRTLLRGVTCTC